MRVTPMKYRPLKDPGEAELQPLDQHPRYVALHAELGAIIARISESEHRQRVGEARARGQAPTATAVQRAKALIAGGRVNVSSPADEISAAAEELQALHAARMAKIEELELVKGELSFQACALFRPDSEEALRKALQACEALFEALEVGRS